MAALATRRRRKRNPVGTAESMYSSFHGVPSTVIDEYQEKEHYHSNLAALGELIGLKVRTVSGYDVTISFDGGKVSNPSKPSLTDKLMAEHIPMPGFPQIIVTRKFAYHWLKSLGWSETKKGYGELDYTVFEPRAVSSPLTDAATRDSHLNKLKGDYRRNPTFWPFDSFSKATIYHVPSGHKFTTTTKHSGHTIYKSTTKNGYVVPSLDRDSVFDSPKDAKKFIDHWTKVSKSNPKGKHKGKSIGPVAASQKFVGDTIGAIYKPMNEFIGMVGGVADKGFKKVGIKGNKRKANPDHVLLCITEDGKNLHIVGGDQSLDLDSLEIDGDLAEKELVTVGEVWGLNYFTAKVFGDGGSEDGETQYIHILGPKETKPPRGGDLWDDAVPPKDDTFGTGELPTLIFDKRNRKLLLSGGIYFADKPLFGQTSPGLEH